MHDQSFDFLLFHREIELSVASLQAGVDGVIVDFESRGKHRRQMGYDTEINSHDIADLVALRYRTDGAVLCRISQPEPEDREIAAVIDAGADEIIVPMLTDVAQAERLLRRVDGASRVMLMVETRGSVADIDRIAKLPADRIYVGLNDLRIDRGSPTIFEPLADGLLENLRDHCRARAFGFGGLTVPGCGDPLPGRHLYAEMARLGCSFTFLRRSFYRDVAGSDLEPVLGAMRADIQRFRSRPMADTQRDHTAMVRAVQDLKSAEHAA